MTKPKKPKKPNLGGRRVLCADGQTRTMYDADREYNGVVTQPDNDAGVCGDPDQCPIAQAVMRAEDAHGRRVVVSIGAKFAYIQRGLRVYRYQIRRDLASLIRTFDRLGVFPAPFGFTLYPPPPADRLGARAKSRGRKAAGTPHNRTGAATRLPTRHVRAPHVWPEDAVQP
jgi:hypothetical protein